MIGMPSPSYILRTALSAFIPREVPPDSRLPTLTTNVHDHDGEESDLCSSTAVRTFLVSQELYPDVGDGFCHREIILAVFKRRTLLLDRNWLAALNRRSTIVPFDENEAVSGPSSR